MKKYLTAVVMLALVVTTSCESERGEVPEPNTTKTGSEDKDFEPTPNVDPKTATWSDITRKLNEAATLQDELFDKHFEK
ncbi:MAG: hypothetical protein HC842_00515 [Cytophagales bacterium]|nr:hypothetical protein [Cytophagales bacterium]